jgi:ABC-type branched-subunit amino acid transport system substrate-binding protein
MAYSRWLERFTKPRKVLSGLVVVAVIVGACSSAAATPTAVPATPGGPTATAAPPTATAASVSFDLKYGILNAFTGDLAVAGPPWDHSARLAIAEIQKDLKTLGLDKQITLEAFTEDDATSTTTGVEAANKLISGDGVDAILGPCCSGVTVAVATGVTIPKGVPMFTMGTAPSVSALESKGTVFRTVPSDALQGAVLAQVVYDQLGAGKTVNIGNRNDAYGSGLASSFSDAYTKLGGKVGVTVAWNPTQATFDTEAQKLVSNSPDGWVFFEYYANWPNVGAALTRTGKWDVNKSFGGDTFQCGDQPACTTPIGMRGTIASVTGGTGWPYFKSVWDANIDPKVHYLGTIEPEAWDDVMIAFLAALDAKSSAPADIVAHVHNVTDPGGTEYTADKLSSAITDLLNGKKIKYVGATGPCVFDAHGDITTSIFDVWQVTGANGVSKILKSVTYKTGQ